MSDAEQETTDWRVFAQWREERKKKRQIRLSVTDTTGWTKLSEYHCRLDLGNHRYIDWWPSANKWCLINKEKHWQQWYKGSLPKTVRKEIEGRLNSVNISKQ